MSAIGAYNTAVAMLEANERDKLFDSVVTAVEQSQSAVVAAAASEGEGGTAASRFDPEKKARVELVAHGTRPRYVRRDILPPRHEVTAMEQMLRDKQERDQANYFLRQGLAGQGGLEAARAEMEAMVLNTAEAAGGEGEGGGVGPSDAGLGYLSAKERQSKEKADAEKQLAMAKKFLERPAVKYGSNRLTSTHNSQGKLEEPWTTVGGRYSVLAGDRTA